MKRLQCAWMVVAMGCIAVIGLQGHGDLGHEQGLQAAPDGPSGMAAEVEWIGHAGGWAGGLALEGAMAYAGIGPRLEIYDLSDPTAPRKIGHSPHLPSNVDDIAIVADNFAYVANAYGGLAVLDVADPTSPDVLKNLALPGVANNITYHAPHVFVTTRHGGLFVFDASTPEDPSQIAKFPDLATALDIVISGDVAFVASGTYGIVAFDVSDPSRPSRIEALSLGDSVEHLDVGTDVLYASLAGGGFGIVDVSSPDRMSEMSRLQYGVGNHRVSLFDDRVYLGGGYEGVIVLDVSDPSSPTELMQFRSPEALQVFVVRPITEGDVSASVDYVAVAAGSDGFQVVDIRDFERPQITWATVPSIGQAAGIDTRGDVLVVSEERGGMSVLDVADPREPRRIGTVRLPGSSYAVALEGDHAFVALGGSGLVSVDLSNVNDPTYVGFVTIEGNPIDVAIAGERAYVVDHVGLKIVDIAEPSAMEVIGAFETPGDAVGVHVNGELAYVADGHQGLRILDVSDPERISEIGAEAEPLQAEDVWVDEDLAFVADDAGLGLRVLDLSDPRTPIGVGMLDQAVGAHRVVVDGRRAYLALRYGQNPRGLAVVDVSEPRQPRLLTHVDTGGPAWDVHVSGDIVYLGLRAVGLRTFRVDPSSVPTPTAPPTATATAQPSPPAGMQWPNSGIRARVQALLVDYYGQEPSQGVGSASLAPLTEADKWLAAKDPDSIWESLGGRIQAIKGGVSPSCHAAATSADFEDCTAARLALTFGLPHDVGNRLFALRYGFAFNESLAIIASQYALYHAFVRDFDAPVSGVHIPSQGRQARDRQGYHERMIQAYETHLRQVLLGMLEDGRHDPGFQASLTRSAGWLLTAYVPVVQAVEEYDAWANPRDRGHALAVITALSQRVWWEWVVPQPDGPRTAGKAELGNQAVFDAWALREPELTGRDRVAYQNRTIYSLRPEELARAPFDGLWFDADYTVPGEWYCNRRFHPNGSADWQRCMALAARESQGGDKSPFGQYYGADDCGHRAGRRTRLDCGETNLGSMAEEWLGTYVGARAGLRLIEHLRAKDDPHLPDGALPAGAYRTITERLGYGVAGFHGGQGRQDDLEWTFEQAAGGVQSIRTLSAATHDGEAQNERHSLGETDTMLGRNAGNDGNTWPESEQEYPGAIENHMPGPNPLYGAVIAQQVLSDKIDGGMSPSLYDAGHRNHPDEFETWVWLLQSSLYRCRGVSDPVDPACFAFSPDHWPYPEDIRREALFIDPRDTSVVPALRYLWRDESQLLDENIIGDAGGSGDAWCQPAQGLVFGRVPAHEGADSSYLVTEGGFGSYNLILQSAGAFMRLAAARSAEPLSSPELAELWRLQKEEVLEPWYDEMERLVFDILDLYGQTGLGYIPDAENVPCLVGGGATVEALSHRASGRLSIESAMAWRARWYSAAALWYWWYDSEWLDIDDRW